jgi:ribosomal-protein-serine acetyltransferase
MQAKATILPARIDGPNGLLLRRWTVDDAEALGQAVAESIDHLRPWMAWVAHEPTPIERRRARIEEWELDWAQGGDVVLGIFLAEQIAGSCGLHRRISPDGLEIGYWIHPSLVRRGLATRVACLLTEAAFAVPGISHVEIHHDKANVGSSGVPRKLGFQLFDEQLDEPEAPGDLGIEYRWRMEKETWAARKSG